MSTWGCMVAIDGDKVHVVTGGALSYDNGDSKIQKDIANKLAKMPADGDIKQNLINAAIEYQKNFYSDHRTTVEGLRNSKPITVNGKPQPEYSQINTTAGAIANTILNAKNIDRLETGGVGDVTILVDRATHDTQNGTKMEYSSMEITCTKIGVNGKAEISGYKVALGNRETEYDEVGDIRTEHPHGIIELSYDHKPSQDELADDIKKVIMGTIDKFDNSGHINMNDLAGMPPHYNEQDLQKSITAIGNDIVTGYYNMQAYKTLEYREYPYDPEHGGFSPDMEGDAGQYAYIRSLNDNAVYSRGNRVFALGKDEVSVMDWDQSHKFVKKALPLGNLSKAQEYNHKPSTETFITVDNNMNIVREIMPIEVERVKEMQNKGVEVLTWHGEIWKDEINTPYVAVKDYEEMLKVPEGPHMETLFENDMLKISSTGRDYDIIATVENKTDDLIVMFDGEIFTGDEARDEMEFETPDLSIEGNDWGGILADEQGIYTLEQLGGHLGIDLLEKLGYEREDDYDIEESVDISGMIEKVQNMAKEYADLPSTMAAFKNNMSLAGVHLNGDKVQIEDVGGKMYSPADYPHKENLANTLGMAISSVEATAKLEKDKIQTQEKKILELDNKIKAKEASRDLGTDR